MKSKYVIRSRISEAKFREIIRYFSLDSSAVQIQKLIGLSRQIINKYLITTRLRFVELSKLLSAPLVRQIKVDESYFGAGRVKGRRGRGANGKPLADSEILTAVKLDPQISLAIISTYNESIVKKNLRQI